MTIVDTHVHTSSDWYEPIEVILFQMKRNGVDKATLVQSRQLYRGHPDNRYLIECARRFPGQFSPIVMLDTERADAGDVLKQWVKRGAGGVRLTPTTRSPGNDPLAIWRTCAELNLPVSCQGKEAEFATDEFSRLVKALPDVPIIIEHLGFVNREEEATPYATYRKLLSLADYPNTYIKVPGLGEICPRAFLYHIPFPFDSIPPFIKMAYEAFGPRRMMWGSDYPPCTRREGYANTLRCLREHLATFCSEQEEQWIFGNTALSLFKFGQGHG